MNVNPQTRALSQPKLRLGQALLSIIGTILRLNRDNSGHISLLLSNRPLLTSHQTMKINKIMKKIRTYRDRIRKEEDKSGTDMYINYKCSNF